MSLTIIPPACIEPEDRRIGRKMDTITGDFQLSGRETAVVGAIDCVANHVVGTSAEGAIFTSLVEVRHQGQCERSIRTGL